MNSYHVVPARWDWPSAIGSFILAFGHLDYLVFAFLKDRLTAEEFALAQKGTFGKRVKTIGRLLDRDSDAADRRVAFDALREKLEPLRVFRNTIAHGHFHFDVGTESLPPAVFLGLPQNVDVPLSQRFDMVRLEEIVAKCGTLGDLISEFELLIGFSAGDEFEVSGGRGTATASFSSQKRPE